MSTTQEPWLRGPIEGVDPLIAPVLYSFQHAREDLMQATDGMSTEQLWAKPVDGATVGFHIRHCGGSVERLIAYAKDEQLSAGQLAAMKAEGAPGASREELLTELDAQFRSAEQVVRSLDLHQLTEPRGVGRKGLPTTVIGLLVHMAEHTMRHVGQAVTTAKFVRSGTGAVEREEHAVWNLEERFWLEGSGVYDAHLDPACVMAFPGMGVIRAAAAVASLRNAPRWTSVRMTGRAIGRTGDVAVLGYRAEAQREGAEPYVAFCTSTYRFDAGTWRLVQHQHTPAA